MLTRPDLILTPLLALGLATSCRAPREVIPVRIEDRYAWIEESVRGRQLIYHSFGDEGLETILFLASIHGDEPAGTPLLETLLTQLEEDPSLTAERRAIVIPVANPDGFAMGTRRNANNTDLNRNFPAQTYLGAPLHGDFAGSEPETKFLMQIVQRFRPSGILTFHQAGEIVDFDGPATGWAYRLAATCEALTVRRVGARPGSLGSWAGNDIGIRVLTIELPRETNDLTRDEAWEIYGAMILEALE